MFLRLRASEKFLDLHLTTGLHDWDMNEEIHLSTTTDQFYQGINIHDIERPAILENGFFLHLLTSSTDDKRNEQYLAQWHYARISRRSLPEELHEPNPADCKGVLNAKHYSPALSSTL